MTTNVTSGKVLVDGKPAPGLALHGYDAVAYFKGGHPVVGDARIAAVHGDATYRFATQDNLKAFNADPAHYAPQFGGFCAFGASVNAKFDGDPMVWRVVDDKLYLNLSPDIQTEWAKDIAANIRKGDDNWGALAERAA